MSRHYDKEGCHIEVAHHGRLTTFSQCARKGKERVTVTDRNNVKYSLLCCGAHQKFLEKGGYVELILKLKDDLRSMQSWHSVFDTVRAHGEMSPVGAMKAELKQLEEHVKWERDMVPHAIWSDVRDELDSFLPLLSLEVQQRVNKFLADKERLEYPRKALA